MHELMLIMKHCIVGRQLSKAARFHHRRFERSLLLTVKWDTFLAGYSGGGKE